MPVISQRKHKIEQSNSYFIDVNNVLFLNIGHIQSSQIILQSIQCFT